jgi:rubredoxin
MLGDMIVLVEQTWNGSSVRYCSLVRSRPIAKKPYNDAMPRELVWIDQPSFRGWGCSQCAWIFNPTGPPSGDTFEEMKQNFEELRDKEFVSHVCANPPRNTNARH